MSRVYSPGGAKPGPLGSKKATGKKAGSGRVTLILRMPVALHDELREHAKAGFRSANAEICRRLMVSLGWSHERMVGDQQKTSSETDGGPHS